MHFYTILTVDFFYNTIFNTILKVDFFITPFLTLKLLFCQFLYSRTSEVARGQVG
uniref:Uncharacterized protein n=1 Tax=Microviridae sp. ctoGr7 TaxID=2827649 RepID=A0A8S5SX78_9VIRU|nr:MAG TPA: hypothetical protein [Microviridae sp. ctoGr7]